MMITRQHDVTLKPAVLMSSLTVSWNIVARREVKREEREPKSVVLPPEETAIVSSARKRDGKVDRQKLFEIFLAEDQTDPSEEEEEITLPLHEGVLHRTNNTSAVISSRDKS